MKTSSMTSRKKNAPRSSASRSRPHATRAATDKKKTDKQTDGEIWNLRLYVAGQTPRSIAAFGNLKRICDQYLKGRYTLEVIDLIKNPQLAQGDQILAIPTLVRKIPAPIKKIIGDLSNTERVLLAIELGSGISGQIG